MSLEEKIALSKGDKWKQVQMQDGVTDEVNDAFKRLQEFAWTQVKDAEAEIVEELAILSRVGRDVDAPTAYKLADQMCSLKPVDVQLLQAYIDTADSTTEAQKNIANIKNVLAIIENALNLIGNSYGHLLMNIWQGGEYYEGLVPPLERLLGLLLPLRKVLRGSVPPDPGSGAFVEDFVAKSYAQRNEFLLEQREMLKAEKLRQKQPRMFR